MAHRHSTKHNPMSRKARVQRRRRAVGITGAVSAFLTLGLGALTDAPEAHADGFDVVIDQIFNAITSSWGDLAGVSGAVPELGSLGLSAADVGSVAAAGPGDSWLTVLEQDWTAFGQQVDTALNTWFSHVDPAAVPTADAQSMSENLLVNPGFETADPSGSGFSGVTIPGWTESGTPTVIAYGTQGGYPLGLSTPFPKFFDFPQTAPPGGGDNFAGGGPVATSSISQTIDSQPQRRSRNAVHAECGPRRPRLGPFLSHRGGHLPRQPWRRPGHRLAQPGHGVGSPRFYRV